MRRFAAPFLSVLMLGMVSQVAQVVLLRDLLMVFHGNELSIGIILSAWMAWVGVGSALGAIVAERTGRVLSVLMLNAAALLPLLAATVLIIRGLQGFFDVLPGAYLSLPDIFVSSFAVMAPVCILIGIQFVLLAKLWRQSDRAEDTSGAGRSHSARTGGRHPRPVQRVCPWHASPRMRAARSPVDVRRWCSANTHPDRWRLRPGPSV